MPAVEDYIEVRCHDLNAGGFSFFYPEPPDFGFLVAVLGTSPNMVRLRARVAHYTDVLMFANGEFVRLNERVAPTRMRDAYGRPATCMVLVGCRFIDRIE